MAIITISRQVGALGDVIAAIVSRKLGLDLISREKVHELALDCDPDYSDACAIYESEHGPNFLERIFFDRPSYTSLFEALTYEVASRGSVVIIGRGSQVVLRDVPGVFRARIVAPTDKRVERLMERFQVTRDEAWDYVRKYDHERRNLITTIFDRDPRDWGLYDLILNTDHFDAGPAAEVLIAAVGRMVQPRDERTLSEKLRNMAMAKRVETLIRRRVTAVIARDVEVGVETGGVATISGRIATREDKERAGEIAAQYPGITRVQNDLRITQLSFGS